MMLLTTNLMLYTTSSWLIYYMTGRFYLSNHFTYLTHPSTPSLLTLTSLYSIWVCFCIYELGFLFLSFFCFFKMSHIEYLYVSFWPFSHTIMPSRSNHVFVNGRIAFIFNGWKVFHYMYLQISPMWKQIFPVKYLISRNGKRWSGYLFA